MMRGKIMSNISLNKLFYVDREEQKKEYEKRFNSKETIKLNLKIGDNQAFFCQTAEIYKLIVSIERTDKKVNKLYSKLPLIAIKQFENRCLIDEIVLTNNIEGIHSTRKEIDEILNDLSKKNKRKRFWGLVNKYKLLVNDDTITMVDCHDIRKIYDDIFLVEIKEEDSSNLPDGEIFRKDVVNVVSETQKVIHNGLYPESKIIEYMGKALEILNDDSIDVLIRTAIFHYLFGYIHPFYDGNGRTSRFISSYMLSHELNPLIAYRISFTIKENLNKYYDSFKICNHLSNMGELTPFIEMFLQIVDESEKQLYSALAKRVAQLNHYLKIISGKFGENDDLKNLYSLLVQASLFSDNGISLKELEEYMKMSYNTLSKILKSVPNEWLLKYQKPNHQVFYSLNLKEFDKMIDSE